MVDGLSQARKETRGSCMKLEITLANGIGLQIASRRRRDMSYPSSRIQKGLVLICDGQDLSEEAVGFGVPILKRGLQTIFPGEVTLHKKEAEQAQNFTAGFTMNLEERIARKGKVTINNPLVYAGKNSLAAIMRRIPNLRKLLSNTSSLLRASLDLDTIYTSDNFSTSVNLDYTIDVDEGKIKVKLLDGAHIPRSVSEFIIMNEQGAHHFDQYQDTSGNYQTGDEIGCWDVVQASEASFIDREHQLSFSLPQVRGARLYRGRELVGNRLAWSGFGYSFSPAQKLFSYEITIKRF